MRERVLLCPECGSRNLHYEAGMMMGQLYRCEDCGYLGAFVIEMDPEEGKG